MKNRVIENMKNKKTIALIILFSLFVISYYPACGSSSFFDPEPDLDCWGFSTWTDIEPGATITGEFTVENIGDPESLLDWEIESYPDWGTWTFDAESGLDLTPEDGIITVNVEVIAPFEEITDFVGFVKFVNQENSNDYCEIDILLATGSHLKIVTPEKALYINNKKIMPFVVPLIVGSIDIDVTACSIIDTVEFYIDGELQHTDTTQPFSWIWDEPAFFRHTITTVALNNTVGINSSREVKVWKFT